MRVETLKNAAMTNLSYLRHVRRTQKIPSSVGLFSMRSGMIPIEFCFSEQKGEKPTWKRDGIFAGDAPLPPADASQVKTKGISANYPPPPTLWVYISCFTESHAGISQIWTFLLKSPLSIDSTSTTIFSAWPFHRDGRGRAGLKGFRPRVWSVLAVGMDQRSRASQLEWCGEGGSSFSAKQFNTGRF